MANTMTELTPRTRARRLATLDTLLTAAPTKGAEVAALRKRLGLDQEQFGELLGVTRGQVSRMEGGRRGVQPPMARLMALVEHLALA